MPRGSQQVACLGPKGTFSHEAALSKFPRARIVLKDTLEDVFDSVFHDEVKYAVLPVENSTDGIIGVTYHKIVEQGREPKVKICGEIYHPISQNLGAYTAVVLDCVKYVHTKKEAWAQCRGWVSRNLPPRVGFVSESSTSRACEIVANAQGEERVAIGPALAMNLNGLQIIAKSIQDLRDNATRFFIVGRHPLRKPRGQVGIKMTMGIVLHDRIGAISDAFKVFTESGVDVRSVKVSPVRAPEIMDWKDWFFVDVLAANGDDGDVLKAIDKLRIQKGLVLTVRILGQYPSADPDETPMKGGELPVVPKDFGMPGGLGLEDIIAAGEGMNTEFKSTLRWNLEEQKVDKNIEFAVIKTVVGFMNSRGGVLLIGVKDTGAICGIEEDYKRLSKHNRDGFELHLQNIVQRAVGSAKAHLINVRFALAEGKDVCILTVQPSPSPVWLQHEGKRTFYVRSGNNTREFDSGDTTEYVKLRWG